MAPPRHARGGMCPLCAPPCCATASVTKRNSDVLDLQEKIANKTCSTLKFIIQREAKNCRTCSLACFIKQTRDISSGLVSHPECLRVAGIGTFQLRAEFGVGIAPKVSALFVACACVAV